MIVLCAWGFWEMKKIGIQFAGALLAAFCATTVLAAEKVDLARAEEIVSGRCFICHGMEGESASPVFPRLAGQHSEYIARQLADFKSGKRNSDTMKPQSEDLTPAEMKALGAFFQAKVVGPRTGLASCSSCHGAKGLGSPQLPRLAGQHPRYIEDQLKQFNKRERTNDNAIMHTIASKLSELETHAVAEYIATLD